MSKNPNKPLKAYTPGVKRSQHPEVLVLADVDNELHVQLVHEDTA